MEGAALDGAEKAGEKLRVHGPTQCSVCLESVSIDAAQRSIAKLKCGHYFHLDCIGSAYNAKGRMQCPNCRDVEDGQWLYANGCSLHDDIPFEEMGYDDEFEIYGGVSEFLISHEIDPISWCPYPPQLSVSLGYPDPELVVNFVYGNMSSACPFDPVNESQSSGYQLGYDSANGAMRHVQRESSTCPFNSANESQSSRYHLGYDSAVGAMRQMQNESSTCPFDPANESRSSRYQLGYDSAITAMRHMQNESISAESTGPQSFTSPDGRHWSLMPPMSSSMPFNDARSTRLMPVHERALPHRPTDIGVQRRPGDVSNASTIQAELLAQGQVHTGRGPVPPSGSHRTGLGTSGRRWRNRGPSGSGRTGQTNESHGQLHWGAATSGGGQDTGINMNWQGDQGIPWRRDGFSGYPWVVPEPESRRWNSAASSSSHNSSYYGAHALGNGAFRTPSAFPGYFRHDGSGDASSMHPHSSRRPR